MISRALATGALGTGAALLISCSGSGAGLIPSGDAGPLQRDFAAVAAAAQKGNGSCTDTETAIARTEEHYQKLPTTVNRGLRKRLHEGIEKLRENALQLCSQPQVQTTPSSTSTHQTPRTQTTTSSPTVTQTTPTQTTPSTGTSTTPGTGGGTPAPGSGGGESPGSGEGGSGGAGEGANGGGSGGAAQEGGK
jgi:hypothetical protein